MFEQVCIVFMSSAAPARLLVDLLAYLAENAVLIPAAERANIRAVRAVISIFAAAGTVTLREEPGRSSQEYGSLQRGFHGFGPE